MSKGLGITLGIAGVLLLVVLLVFGSYVSAQKQMVARDQDVKDAWSEVDVQMQRRADLIPNLVETVKGFTKEESSVFTEVAQARDGLMNAQTPEAKIAANGQLDGALAKVLVLTENYPTLRSSDQFMRLQDELSGTENRISVARKRYNDAIQQEHRSPNRRRRTVHRSRSKWWFSRTLIRPAIMCQRWPAVL